ncbi:hypothetical protein ETAA8_00250 [Anatilimnocola aggregata]|uniref:DUF1552 domain-containing protein n=1 Tax=Anatilimnocola aggregata TaxID=2528021 RepID=A0A517Y3Z9_9BACT|nr:DUF1552 domain-containing protein [Anatilimnocola aggregata]QDU24964.1 hypothetical protein ETAA8_00250 [Anatilimnocola aggregata]
MKPIPRRLFLKNAGIAIGLPLLDSMLPTGCLGAAPAASPRRIVCIGVPFGFDPTAFVPVAAGRDYVLPSHLAHLAAYRDDFTVISGLSHPNTGGGGHKAEAVMLTGAPYPDYSHNLKNTISVDQAFAAKLRGETRYESFALTTQGQSLSVTANGVSIPAIGSPSAVFKKLFLAATPAEMDAELRRIDEGRSMLDFVSDRAKNLNRQISGADRQRVDEYFESVRDVERQLKMTREWVNRPKPPAIGGEPKDIGDNQQQQAKFRLMIDMIHLALVTDSTRAISLMTFGMHHDLSHHGKEPKKLAACRQVEVELMLAFGGLLGKLKNAKEGGSTLLDSTMVMMTSNLRDGNTHWTYNLPVILAGGGFRHGQHLAFNRSYLDEVSQELKPAPETKIKSEKKIPLMGQDQQPLCNLYTSMLQRGGVEIERFSSATGSLNGLV